MDWKRALNRVIVSHRRGIMGTVIFHLLLMIFLLSMELSRVNVHSEMEIMMETPNPEELHRQREELQRREEIRQKSTAGEVEKMLRSIAVNENVKRQETNRETSVEEYVEEILEELHDSGSQGRYKAVTDKHYKNDSLQYLSDRKERERERDSLKSVFYSGESSVSYNLKDRYARFLPIPVFKCEFGGKVVVEIWVNPKGAVQKAVVLEEQSEADDCLWRVAVDAAGRSRFNVSPDAPAMQKGTITYHFVKQ